MTAPLPVPDLVTVLLHKLVEDNRHELSRAQSQTGRVNVNLEIHFVNGKPRWHSAAAYFSEHQQYTKESIVGE